MRASGQTPYRQPSEPESGQKWDIISCAGAVVVSIIYKRVNSETSETHLEGGWRRMQRGWRNGTPARFQGRRGMRVSRGGRGLRTPGGRWITIKETKTRHVEARAVQTANLNELGTTELPIPQIPVLTSQWARTPQKDYTSIHPRRVKGPMPVGGHGKAESESSSRLETLCSVDARARGMRQRTSTYTLNELRRVQQMLRGNAGEKETHQVRRQLDKTYRSTQDALGIRPANAAISPRARDPAASPNGFPQDSLAAMTDAWRSKSSGMSRCGGSTQTIAIGLYQYKKIGKTSPAYTESLRRARRQYSALGDADEPQDRGWDGKRVGFKGRRTSLSVGQYVTTSALQHVAAESRRSGGAVADENRRKISQRSCGVRMCAQSTVAGKCADQGGVRGRRSAGGGRPGQARPRPGTRGGGPPSRRKGAQGRGGVNAKRWSSLSAPREKGCLKKICGWPGGEEGECRGKTHYGGDLVALLAHGLEQIGWNLARDNAEVVLRRRGGSGSVPA
ncbi:hypothetical protein DFH09DRAFT_1090251 [Mycena vulgaris]|nr:hypothetical protein DFH09DRAFT_1090251 [Mycena vulgaris]